MPHRRCGLRRIGCSAALSIAAEYTFVLSRPESNVRASESVVVFKRLRRFSFTRGRSRPRGKSSLLSMRLGICHLPGVHSARLEAHILVKKPTEHSIVSRRPWFPEWDTVIENRCPRDRDGGGTLAGSSGAMGGEVHGAGSTDANHICSCLALLAGVITPYPDRIEQGTLLLGLCDHPLGS